MKRSASMMMSLLSSVVVVSLAFGAAGPNTATKSLQQAAGDGDLAQVSQVIANRSDVNARDGEGRTALACAIVGEHVDVVTTLVTAGADVNIKSQQGTPLYLAAHWGQIDVVRLLLAHGADVNASDDVVGTALHAAAAMGHREVVGLLLERGANANAQTQSGATPLAVAEVTQHREVAELLRQHQGVTQSNPRPMRPMQQRPYDTMVLQEGQVNAPGANVQAGNPLDVLADPNAIMRTVASFPGLADALAALEEKSKSEQRNWQQRRTDNRTTVLRAADAQFAEEMALLKTTATQENAVRTVQAIDALAAKRQARYDVLMDVLREERRAALLAEREERRSAGRAGTTTRGRGRGRGTETTETTAAATEPARAGRPRDPNAPPLDADAQAQLQAWQGAAEDNRAALEVVTTTDLRELNSLRQVAVAERARRTSATVEALMLARQQRKEHVLERIAADEERQQRLEERAATRGRGAERGTTENDTTTQGRGRRSR